MSYQVKIRTESGEERVLYEPQPKQVELHRNRAPNILFGGAAGGAKSHGLRWHGIIACLRHRNLRVLLLRRRFTDLELSHLLKIPIEVPPELAHWISARKRLEFDNGSVLQFGYAKTREDFSQYLSSEWDIILVDEAGEFIPWMLEVLPSRLRTTNPNIEPQFILGSNPGGPSHLFLKSHAIDKEVYADLEVGEYHPEEWAFIPSFVKDNIHINPGYLKRLERLPEKEKQAYLYGNWDSFVGQVFTEWRRDLHVCREEVPRGWFWAGGLDWGMRNPGWYGQFATGPDDDTILRKELYFRNLTAYDAGVKIGHLSVPYPIQYIGADASMWDKTGTSSPTIAEELQVGIQSVYGEQAVAPQLIAVAKPKGSRFASQQVCHRLLAWSEDDAHIVQPWMRPKFRVHEDCPHFIRTIPALTHDVDKPEEVDSDGEDHCFGGSSEVFTSEGPALLVELVGTEGLIWTRFGWRAYRSCRQTACASPLVRLSCKDGSWVDCTPDHRFLTREGVWVEAQHLTGRYVAWSMPERNGTGAATTTTPTERASFSIGEYGRMWLVRFQKAWRYTTWTVMDATTQWRTWLSSQGRNISELSRETVIHRKRGRSPFGAMLCLSAKSAGSDSLVAGQTGPAHDGVPNSAATEAKTRKGVYPSPVGYVVARSGARAMLALRKPAATNADGCYVVSVKQIDPDDVYCLTVPDVGEFCLANGAVVANCYDGWRYWAMSRPQGPEAAPTWAPEGVHPGLTKRGERREPQAPWERALREDRSGMEEAGW